MFDTIDGRDVVYTVVGLALFGLTLQPALARYKLFNLPLFYALFGAAAGMAGYGMIDPLASTLHAKVVEHASELIVIISLAGAGLAIDTVGSWRNWNPTWRLLLVTMPITVVGVAALGHGWLGLTIPGALLLAAALAPTDPVLARSVQVSPPGQDEQPMEVALTAEAGMNDGLAFPFVYLAIHAAALGVGQMFQGEAWFWSWLSFDFAYRVIVGIVIGYGVGLVISRIIFSPVGDGSQGAWNAVVVVLASTLLAYGITEGVDGYGFLAVFFATRAGRSNTRGTSNEGYEKFVHHGAEQLEAILLAVLLLWLGTFIGSGALSGLRWQEVAFALALVLVLRPAAGLLALVGHDCTDISRRKVAFFGIRGMGSVFYIAYAQNHAQFGDIDAVWRIAAVTILVSILIHGYAANYWLEGDEQLGEVHPHHEDGEGDREAA
ncbi:cation:proton antiporter [Jannaschia aquimarina]|uniref:Potassium/proton antiporter n=1 Tax=Jannaschia aquimarina TaxID=935700 RepID=A0A0D1D7H1_9RHOB|nr:cation:proton antiporter [Jannaschia aquimarina]KIT15918.1 potassium/proton antiporter [Jannaschia aquimarina]SNS97785.1 sodium/proton antiporter, CPA1 family [Jannaschia aquimarina]